MIQNSSKIFSKFIHTHITFVSCDMVNFGVRQSRPKCLIWRQDLNGLAYYMLGISHFTPAAWRRLFRAAFGVAAAALLSHRGETPFHSKHSTPCVLNPSCKHDAAARHLHHERSQHPDEKRWEIYPSYYKRLVYYIFSASFLCLRIASLHGFANQNQRKNIRWRGRRFVLFSNHTASERHM